MRFGIVHGGARGEREQKSPSSPCNGPVLRQPTRTQPPARAPRASCVTVACSAPCGDAQPASRRNTRAPHRRYKGGKGIRRSEEQPNEPLQVVAAHGKSSRTARRYCMVAERHNLGYHKRQRSNIHQEKGSNAAAQPHAAKKGRTVCPQHKVEGARL